MSSTQKIVMLTGMSGAGKSQALKSLEDIGYEAIDNIPLSMISMVIGKAGDGPERLALGVDVRSRDFSPETLFEAIEPWQNHQSKECDLSLVFMDCDDDVLQRRFTETRRKHPLSHDRTVNDGIALERELLGPVRERADDLVNTSKFSIHDLKRYMQDHFSEEKSELLVFVTSFSFREGLPREADMVVDVRFLKNPHYDENLREHTGRDEAVGAFIEQDEGFAPFYENLTRLMEPLLPRYRDEGKSYFTLAFGCTGGKHRSVYLTEKLAGFLTGLGYKVGIRHRDLKTK